MESQSMPLDYYLNLYKDIDAPRKETSQRKDISIQEVSASDEVVIRLSRMDIVILSFVVGAVLSLIIALTYKVFSARKGVPKEDAREISADVWYARMLAEEGFDYPCEDIGDALK